MLAQYRTLTYAYTGDGQLYSVHDSATGKTSRYMYDTLGRLIQSRDEDVRTAVTYNSFNQLTKWSYSSRLDNAYETYTYDSTEDNSISDGTLTAMRMLSGDTLHYSYDSLQRLSEKYITGKVWEEYSYDGTRVATKTNWMGSLKTHDFTYTYDVLGNILSQRDALTGITTSYTYDRMGQLTGTTYEDENGVYRTESYTYDNAGNIKTFNNGTSSLTFGYGNEQWKDLLTTVTKDGENHTITYDKIGNPIKYYNGYSLDHYLTWTEGRRLETYTYNSETWEYTYNADGLRIRKENPDGSYIEYLLADGRYIGEIHFTDTDAVDLYIRYNYDESGSVMGISLWDAGHSSAWEDYYFLKNLQGDVLKVYRSDGAVAATYSYNSWGKVAGVGEVTFNGKPIHELNPFRYRSYYYDQETFFYYLQSRYYDPAIGRFINADAFASTGQGILGFNMFAYCNNNPVNMVDSTGTRPVVGSGPYSQTDREKKRSFAYMYSNGYTLFLDDLAMSESTDDYSIVNQYGYLGRYQMNTLSLIDAGFLDEFGNWTALANSFGVYSTQDFLNSPAAQDFAIKCYHIKICDYIRYYGLDAYLGTTYDGVVVTMSGLLAASHLVGAAGLSNAMKSGGVITDGNGVKASTYMLKFGGYNVYGVWYS